MEHVIEAVLEVLLGLVKAKPDKIPEMEYVNSFIVKHPIKKTLVRVFVSMAVIVIFSLLWMLIKRNREALFAVFVVLGIVLLILFLIALSFRCFVNEDRLLRSYWGMFKKEIKWKDILCVRTIEQKDEKAVIIALYNYDGKCVIDFNTDMQNAWYLVKMAEHKGIEIRKERELTLKQISKL